MSGNNEQPMQVGKIRFGKVGHAFSAGGFGKPVVNDASFEPSSQILVKQLIDSVLEWWEHARYESVVGYFVEGGAETFPPFPNKPDFVKSAEELKKVLESN